MNGSRWLFPVLFIAFWSACALCAQTGNQSGLAASSADTAVAATTVSGQVLNASTEMPVARALVRLGGRAMLTDHEGKFEFDQYSGTGGMLQVIKPGYYFSLDSPGVGGMNVQPSQLAAPLQLRLYPEALLTGTLTSPDGDPLATVPISALRLVFSDDGSSWVPTAQTFTNAHGDFRLPVAAGEYRLETQYTALRNSDNVVLPEMAPDNTSSDVSDVIRIQSGVQQHFDLQPFVGRPHTVKATFDTGSRAGFARIIARATNGPSFPIAAARSGEGGAYRIELPNGTYTLTATTNNRDELEQAQTSVTVADRDISGVVFHFMPLPSIPVVLAVDSSAASDETAPAPTLPQLGLALENVQPDSDQRVSTIRLSSQRDGSFAFAAAPGSYRLESIANTGWYVRSASYGDSDILQQDIVVAADSGGVPIHVTVSNDTGSLQGGVTLHGQPASCWIYLIATTPSAKPVISLRSNAEGGYSSKNLPPGSYQAVAFESRHHANYSDPASLSPYSTHVGSVTIGPGDNATLNLDAVSDAEIIQ